MMKKETPYKWWFHSHQRSSNRSPWLQSALADLDMKTKTMLKLIEEDADSFAQRAEMYYKKRPELINMVEDFYKTHRSLAERYDLIKSESANRLLTALGSPFAAKSQQPKLIDQFDQTYDSHSETEIRYPFPTKHQQPKLLAGVHQFDQTYNNQCQEPNLMAGVDQLDQTYGSRSETENSEDSAESEVDDPEHDNETVHQNNIGEVEEPEQEVKAYETEVAGLVSKNEVKKLLEEIERLKEENRMQKEQLLQKDEEKREAIRQLSSAVEVLKVENDYLRKSAPKNPPKKRGLFEFEKWIDVFSGLLFSSSARSPGPLASL